MAHEHDLDAALEAARRAGRLILAAYASFTAIPDARADITTEVDRQSQEIILQCLRDRFRGDALCAEEETPTLAAAVRSGPRLWIVDPIDGTRGFAQKNGEFSVMIALLEEGRVVVGVVLEPATGRLTYAAARRRLLAGGRRSGPDGLPRHGRARPCRGDAHAEPVEEGRRAVAAAAGAGAGARPRNLLRRRQAGPDRARRRGLLRQLLRSLSRLGRLRRPHPRSRKPAASSPAWAASRLFTARRARGSVTACSLPTASSTPPPSSAAGRCG